MNKLIAADVVDAKAARALHAKSSAANMNPLGFHPSLAGAKKALFESAGFPASSFGLPPTTDITSLTSSKRIRAHSMDDMCRFFRVPMPDMSQSINHCDQRQDHIKTSSVSATGSDTIGNHADAARASDPTTATCASHIVSNPPLNKSQQILGSVDDTPSPINVDRLCHGSSSLQNDDNIIIEDSLPRDEVEPPLITPDVTTTSSTTRNVPVRNDGVYVSRDKSSYEASRKQRMIGLTKLFQWPSKMINVLANRTTSTSTSSSRQPTPTQQVQPVDSSFDHDRHAYLQSLQKAMSSVSMSTSFSGIDTPATALMMLSAGLFDELGVDSNGLDAQLVLKHTPSNLWACEWFSRSQQELLRHPHQPKHIFSDINSFWLKSIGNRIEALVDKQLINTVLKRLVLTTSTVKTSGYCVKCQTECVASQLL